MGSRLPGKHDLAGFGRSVLAVVEGVAPAVAAPLVAVLAKHRTVFPVVDVVYGIHARQPFFDQKAAGVVVVAVGIAVQDGGVRSRSQTVVRLGRQDPTHPAQGIVYGVGFQTVGTVQAYRQDGFPIVVRKAFCHQAVFVRHHGLFQTARRIITAAYQTAVRRHPVKTHFIRAVVAVGRCDSFAGSMPGRARACLFRHPVRRAPVVFRHAEGIRLLGRSVDRPVRSIGKAGVEIP